MKTVMFGEVNLPEMWKWTYGTGMKSLVLHLPYVHEGAWLHMTPAAIKTIRPSMLVTQCTTCFHPEEQEWEEVEDGYMYEGDDIDEDGNIPIPNSPPPSFFEWSVSPLVL